MADARAMLVDKAAELEAALGVLSAPAADQGGISFGKRVGDGTSLAVERLSQVAVHDRMQVTLADVRRALAKLDQETYGRCDRCGAAIPPARLDALPWAILCVPCASGE